MKKKNNKYIETRIENGCERNCEICKATHYFDEKDKKINDIEIALYMCKFKETNEIKRVCGNCLEELLSQHKIMIYRWNNEKEECVWE